MNTKRTLFTITFIFTSISLFAQDSEFVVLVKGIASQLLGSHLSTSSTFTLLIVAISHFLLKKLSEAKNIIKQLVTLGVGVSLSLIGSYAEIGIFIEKSLVESILLAFPIALEANGLFAAGKNLKKEGVPVVMEILNKLKKKN